MCFAAGCVSFPYAMAKLPQGNPEGKLLTIPCFLKNNIMRLPALQKRNL